MDIKVMERAASYILESDNPTLDGALESVSFELSPLTDEAQSHLAVEVFKAAIIKQSADRIVGAINSLVMAVEQLKGEA